MTLNAFASACLAVGLVIAPLAAWPQAPAAQEGVASRPVRQQMRLNFSSEIPPVVRTLGWNQPVYPLKARRMMQEGRVVLRIAMQPSGEHEIEIEESSGWPVLDQSALEAMRGLAFDDGQPLLRPTRFLLPVRFRIAPPAASQD